MHSSEVGGGRVRFTRSKGTFRNRTLIRFFNYLTPYVFQAIWVKALELVLHSRGLKIESMNRRLY